MRKIPQQYTSLENDLVENNNFAKDKIKTTNVNVLLNRVRLDKRRDLKKKIFFVSLLVLLISIIGIFTVI